MKQWHRCERWYENGFHCPYAGGRKRTPGGRGPDPLLGFFLDEDRPDIKTSAPDLEEALTDAAIQEFDRARAEVAERMDSPAESRKDGVPEAPPVDRQPGGFKPPATPKLPPLLIPPVSRPGGQPQGARVPRDPGDIGERGIPRGAPAPGFASKPSAGGLYRPTLEAVTLVGEPFSKPGIGDRIWDSLERSSFDWQEAMFAAAAALLMSQLVRSLALTLQGASSLAVGRGEMRVSWLLRSQVNTRPLPGAPRGQGSGGGGLLFSTSALLRGFFDDRIE